MKQAMPEIIIEKNTACPAIAGNMIVLYTKSKHCHKL